MKEELNKITNSIQLLKKGNKFVKLNLNDMKKLINENNTEKYGIDLEEAQNIYKLLENKDNIKRDLIGVNEKDEDIKKRLDSFRGFNSIDYDLSDPDYYNHKNSILNSIKCRDSIKIYYDYNKLLPLYYLEETFENSLSKNEKDVGTEEKDTSIKKRKFI